MMRVPLVEHGDCSPTLTMRRLCVTVQRTCYWTARERPSMRTVLPHLNRDEAKREPTLVGLHCSSPSTLIGI
jgi:hypothetical protein